MNPARPSNAGASLVVTLLVIAVLTIIVVSFLQSMSTERTTAKSYADVLRATLATDAAVESAADTIAQLMTDNPFHAIGYERLSGSAPNSTPYPVFLGAPTTTDEPQKIFLVSHQASEDLNSQLNNGSPIDLNQNFGADGDFGWIGTPLRRQSATNWTLTRTPHRAIWINILLNPTLPEQPNPNSANFNPVVSRYAYWVEDEASKLDISLAGNSDGTNNAFRRSTPVSVEPADLDLGALPVTNRRPLADSVASAEANLALVEFRRLIADFPIDDRILGNLDLTDTTSDLGEIGKFHTTQYSVSNELASTGRRRINLNALVTNSNNPNVIAADLSDIIFAITGRQIFDFPGTPHNINSTGANASFSGIFLEEEADTDNAALPDFGKRFYTNPDFPAPTPGELKSDHEAVYLLKLAANIRDYIDSDSQPTFVDFSGTVLSGARPSTSWLGGEEPIAIGKEGVPYLQEHAWWGRLDNVQIIPGSAPSNRRSIDFRMDHFFEFLNPTTKDFTAPADTILKVYNLPSLDGNQFGDLDLPDFELDLSGVVFPAGRATVVTTAPEGEAPTNMIPATAIVRNIDPGDDKRIFAGHLANAQVGGGTGDSRRFGTRMKRDGSITSTDYNSEFILSTPLGAIDAFPHLSLIASTGSPLEMTRSVSGTRGTWSIPESDRNNRRFVFGNSLRGNDAESRTGDPRSLNEQMETVGGSNNAYGFDQARFFTGFEGTGSDTTANTDFPKDMTIGRAAIRFVAPANWPDYHVTLADSANTAYAVVSDAPMISVGELGHIYDPHRIASPQDDGFSGFVSPLPTTRILRARGGGRTLKIGQRDDIVNATSDRFISPSATSVGWANSAWRLTDVFSAEHNSTNPLSDFSSRAKININGVLRDGGLAMRAALRNFLFLPAPDGDSARADRQISEAEMTNLINNLTNYLTQFGPMLERGELSQLTFFSAPNPLGGRSSSTSMDRSREEVFRRIVELVTTRSLTFSVYTIGQAVRQDANGRITPIATDRQRFIIQFEPLIEDEPNDRATGYKWRIIDVSK